MLRTPLDLGPLYLSQHMMAVVYVKGASTDKLKLMSADKGDNTLKVCAPCKRVKICLRTWFILIVYLLFTIWPGGLGF